MLGFVSSPRFVDHVLPGAAPDREGGHPERPDRIRALHAAVRRAGVISSPDPWPQFDLAYNLERNAPPAVELPEPEPVQDEPLLRVHSGQYIQRIGQIQARGGGYADHGETYVGPRSDTVARLAVACALQAGDAVMAGQVRRAFAAVRPPGHHAEPGRAMGFCLYATAAVLVRHLQAVHGLARVAVVDFDVHHGNGIQAVFWEDPTVLNISLHQDPRTLWPGTGYAEETGAGAGRGFTVNIPLPPGTGDELYLRALREQVADRVMAFGPQALVVCAGFDAHAADPLAGLELSSAGFGEIGRELAQLANRACVGRLVATLEGGYNLQALGESVVSFLNGISA